MPQGKLGQYAVVRELGRGGMGRVLEAVDEPLGRRVAVKVLLTTSTDQVHRRRFIEEARITGRLEHPGIAPIYNLGHGPDGSDYFSMKLVSGQDLNEILKARERGDRETLRTFTLARLLSIFERIVETVGYAHAQRILHRDLKPANIMIGAHGEVWVLDWGLAKLMKPGESKVDAAAPPTAPPPANANPELTDPGSTVGTPQYMAPEQARGNPLDFRTDVFGLGGILYKMLTGLSPNQGPDYMGTLMNAALEQVVPVRLTPKGRRAPKALAAITDKCLAGRREDRYASAEELLADLRAYVAGDPIKARPDGLAGMLLRLLRRHYRAAIGLGGAIALLLVGWTVAATLLAAKDRQALAAERHAQDAERARQAAVAESSARAQRRMRAFASYAEATDLLMRGQVPDRAAQLLEEALRTDPEFPEAQYALGEALRLAGLPDKAAPAYLRANELSRKITGKPHLQALLAAGMAYDGAGEYAQSEQCFVQAEKEGADQPLALVGRAFRLLHTRKLKDARTAADEALRKAPHFWETQFAAGYVLAELANMGIVPPEPSRSQAIALFRKALELSPRQAETWIWLGRTLQNTGLRENYGDAVRCFDQAVALEPRNGNRYISRGLYRLAGGNAAGAAADLQKARELGAARGLLLYADTVVAGQRHDYATAFQLIGELIRETRDWPPHVGNWLVLGFQLRRDNEIRGKFEAWCRDNPEYPEVYALKGQVKARDGDYKGALADDRAGLKVGPYNVKLRSQLALHFLLARQWQEALTAADAVLELAPRDFTALTVRVRALAVLGRGDEAKTLLDQLAKDYPARAKEIDVVRRDVADRLPK
jgi:tetratricopeptide (TPR) repeat protein